MTPVISPWVFYAIHVAEGVSLLATLITVLQNLKDKGDNMKMYPYTKYIWCFGKRLIFRDGKYHGWYNPRKKDI